jgi:hypothetical protein
MWSGQGFRLRITDAGRCGAGCVAFDCNACLCSRASTLHGGQAGSSRQVLIETVRSSQEGG